jgi:hypothetical protein
VHGSGLGPTIARAYARAHEVTSSTSPKRTEHASNSSSRAAE